MMNNTIQNNEKSSDKKWLMFVIAAIPMIAAIVYSMYITKDCGNISMSDIDYLYQVKRILTANLLLFFAESFTIACLLTPLAHFFWRPDASIHKPYYNKAQLRFYHFESLVIALILTLPLIFIMNLSHHCRLGDLSSFDQMKMLTCINKNIRGESETETERFDSVPYCRSYSRGGKSVNSMAVQLLTSIDNKDHNEKLLIPYSEALYNYDHYWDSRCEVTYYVDTCIVADVKIIDKN